MGSRQGPDKLGTDFLGLWGTQRMGICTRSVVVLDRHHETASVNYDISCIYVFFSNFGFHCVG